MSPTDLYALPTAAAFRLNRAEYPSEPPFHPGVAYPEYKLGIIGPSNEVYEAVRQILHLLKLDEGNYGSCHWNPFGSLVSPGDVVVIKPNFLWHSHRYIADQFDQVITHGSIIRAVVDFVLIALQGSGRIWITDGPQLDANCNEILRRTGTDRVCEFYKTATEVPVRFLDLRDTWEDVRGDVLYGTTKLPGDPAGAVEINLADRSRFVEHGGSGNYYGATYNQTETNFHHSQGRHEYRISRTVASADVFINLPKMKTHKKVGVTLSLKNLVGINTGRNWLPHHTDGDTSNGGDQFPKPSIRGKSERWGVRNLERLTLMNPRFFAPIYRIAKRLAIPFYGHTKETIRTGNWHGNDTCWRMVQDINRCLIYSDGTNFPTKIPKKYFSLVDGVIAGDGKGPEAPDRFEAGLLVGGFNPVLVDCSVARLMGFDPMRLASLREAFAQSDLPLASFRYEEMRLVSNIESWNCILSKIDPESCYHFKPHFGWTGQIEWNSQTDSRSTKAG